MSGGGGKKLKKVTKSAPAGRTAKNFKENFAYIVVIKDFAP